MYLIKVRWFNIIAPLVAFAATILIVPAAHAYTVDIKGGVSSTTTYTDDTVYIATSGTPGYIKWNSDISDAVGSCVVANFPKPPYSYFTGVSSGGAKQTGGITQTTAYKVECFVDGYLVASDSVTFTVGAAPIVTPPFSVRNSSRSPLYQVIPSGSQGVNAHVLQITNNANEAISVGALELAILTDIGFPSQSISRISLYSGTTQLGASGAYSSSTTPIIFSTPLIVQAFDSAEITVKVDVHQQGPGQPGIAGARVLVQHTGYGVPKSTSYAVGLTSGLQYGATNGWTLSNGFRAFRTTPIVTQIVPSTGTLVSGTNTLNQVKITAGPTRELTMRRLVFQTSVAPCLGPLSYELWGDYGRVHASLLTADALGRVVATFSETSSERIIPAGASKTFTLRATNVASAGYGYISSRLLGDAAYAENAGMLSAYQWEALLSAATTSNFLWSPNTYTLSTASSTDWTNGYGVMGLPSAGLRDVLLAGSTSGSCVASIKMTAPVGGETVMPLGNPLVIQWTPNGDNPNVKAYLESYSNGTYATLGEMIPSARGSIYWVGELDRWGNYPAPGSYYVRIVDTATGAWDRSDGMITMLPVDYMSADLKINGTDGPIASSKDLVTASWTSKNATSCEIHNFYGIPVIKNLPPSGSQLMSFGVNDGVYQSGIALACSSPYGIRYDRVAVDPLPYPPENDAKIKYYFNAKSQIKYSEYMYAQGNTETAVANLVNAQATMDTLKFMVATGSTESATIDQIKAIIAQTISLINNQQYSSVNEQFALLDALLVQLRHLFGVVATQCSDGIDNDGDALIDNADHGCMNTSDTNEYNPSPVPTTFTVGQRVKIKPGETVSGTYIWNVNLDSIVDIASSDYYTNIVNYPLRYGSASTTSGWWWPIETIKAIGYASEFYLTSVPYGCADGLDNDSDGKIDYPADPGCSSSSDNDEYNVPPVNAAVINLALIDAQADTVLFNIGEGNVIFTNNLPSSSINISAVTTGEVSKVLFYQNGAFVRSEGTAPYALAGDSNGNYYAWSYKLDVPYQITAIPFDLYGATGTPYSLNFTLHNEVATTTPPAVCADGADNDGDGKIDYPADPGCTSNSDNDEYNAPTTPSYGANIVTNPGFESQKNGWSGWGTRVKLSPSEKYTGTYGMEFVHNTTGTRTLNNGTTYSVVPGSKVLASAYVKAVGSGTTDAFLELEWRNASGSILKRDQVAYTGGATAWTKIEKTLTVPANATKLKIRLKDSATPSVGSVFFDDISVQLAETVTASEGFFSSMFSNILTAVNAVSASK